MFRYYFIATSTIRLNFKVDDLILARHFFLLFSFQRTSLNTISKTTHCLHLQVFAFFVRVIFITLVQLVSATSFVLFVVLVA